jgi:hypothetical protein
MANKRITNTQKTLTITRIEWSKKHPFNLSAISDIYYVNLANRIFKTLKNDKSLSKSGISSFVLKYSAMLSTLYFEDIISQTGLFNSFREIHTRMYGKKLPFIEIFDDYDYDYDDINPEDIQFLIWSIAQEENIIQDTSQIINIENPVILYISLTIYDILDTQFENAPVNEEFYKILHENNYTEDFLLFRQLTHWLHYDSYLSMNYPKIDFFNEMESLTETIKQIGIDENIIKYSTQNSLIFSSVCSPLAVHAVEWLGGLLATPEMDNIVSSFDFRPLSGYKIESYDENFIYLIDRKDKTKLVMDINSLENKSDFQTYDSLSAMLVLFDGVWRLNGFAVFGNADNEKEEEAIALENTKKMNDRENKLRSYTQVMEYSNNKPLLFFRIYNDWIDYMMKVFPEAPNKDVFENMDYKNEKNFAFFSHPELGSILVPDIAPGIKAPENTFYDQINDSSVALGIVCGAFAIPFEFLDYLLKNNLLPDASVNSLKSEEHGKKLVQENIEFMARFFNHKLYRKS